MGSSTDTVRLNLPYDDFVLTEASSLQSPSSIVAPYFQNQSRDPFIPIEQPCRLGNYVDYAINVSSPSDVVRGVQFAQSRNVRLVIKATGHE